MAYATLAQLKSALSITAADTISDDVLQLSLDSASEQIDVFCGRTFGTAGSAVRYYAGRGAVMDTVEIDDATTISEVATSIDGVTWTAMPTTSWQAEPLNNLSDGITWPYTRLRVVGNNAAYFPNLNGQASVRVTGTFGWGSTPSAVVRACVAQASRLHARNFSPYGVAGVGDMGVVRLSAGLDVDVEQLLQPYRRQRGIA